MFGSGSSQFDALRRHLLSHNEVRREVEFAFSSLLTAANPSDRGLRFLFGSGAEWIMASAAWSAGVLTAPAGHNANGFDLGDLLDKAKGLWSVKASASTSASQIRLKNFMGDGGRVDWTEPTVFVGPYLKGAVLVDPRSHTEVAEAASNIGDALVLGGGAVKAFAKSHPQNYIPFDVAVNHGGASADRYAFVKSVITPDHFPILSKPFLAAAPVADRSRVEEITRLALLRDQGVLDEEQFKRAVDTVIR
ncbi:hypothetical protein [Agrococcus sp. SCSIO52902]|uniref:hypothetical protein n=1 Tax=Agrococcus sp. SCSIO52902 TaxID=2933290 RepID=UPI001FF1A95B|nr:hypothetical protein [Agrococcus sp. SCSIO52902]UOW01872.1 hypothetical protein MU522_05595 [Agrococcus sp. SCSIO52902]